jgi:hypothetical protein
MSRTITDEKIKLSIIIDGNDAQKELLDLEKATRKLTEENKTLNLEKKALERQGKQESEQYKALTATIKQNTAEIAQNKTKMSQLQNEIGLTGLTMNQLTQKATVLRMTLKNLIPGSADYQKYKAELAQVTARISELSGKAQQSKLSLSSMADGFNKYQGIALSFIAGLTGVVFSIQKIIDINGKLSDAQADVMKTTRMSKEEVEALAKSFGLLKTRTQRIELLGIAQVAGELNIAKTEVFDFVKVMDRAGVALGDSFEGGAEEVASKLGKIKNLYKELKESGVELSFNAVGSALNDLGADGNATAGNVADFVTRIGSMPEAFKPSIAVALGLGAAFEETGLNAEKSASNYSKVITIAANNVEGFAKVMGRPKKEMEDLMNTNPNEFFLQFANSIKDLEPVALAKVLDNLKLNDNEVKQVISAAGNNTDLFRQKIDLANKSLNEGTSLTDEFNIKNSNLAATLEKVKKTINGWFSSDAFNAWLFNMVTGFAELIGATDNVDSSVQKWKNTLVFTAKIIAVVTSALITNVGWQKLVALWTTRNTEATLLYTIASKARAFADGIGMFTSQALAAVMMLLRGNVVGATQAFRVMTAAMMTTPWGFILGAVAAIGTAYLAFSDSAKEAATAQSMMAEVSKEVEAAVAAQSAEFMSLIAVVQDETASEEARNAALVRAKEIGGEQVKSLTLQNAATLEGKNIIDQYIKSLEKKAMLEVLQARQAAIIKEMSDKKNMSLQEEIKWYDELWASVKNFGNVNLAAGDVVVTASKRRTSALDELQKKLNFTNAEMKEFLKANPNVIKSVEETGSAGTGDGSGTGDDKTKKNPNSSAAELAKLKFEDEQRYADATLNLRRRLQDESIAMMEEGYEKEMAIENLRYIRAMQDLERQKVNKEELIKIDADIAKAQEDGDRTKVAALTQIKEGWKAKNATINDQINQLEINQLSIHNQKVGIIQEKSFAKSIKDLQEQYAREKTVRETAFLTEINGINDLKTAKDKLKEMGYKDSLSAIKTLEEAKTALKKQFNVAELNEQEKHLREVLAKFDEIVKKNGGTFIDLSLLTPEQIENFKKDAESLGLTLQQLIDKKNELLGVSAGDKQAALDKLGLGGQADILGFNQNNWDAFFQNLKTGVNGIESMVFAVSALTNLWGQYDKYLQANEAAKLRDFQKNANTKKNTLKKQLDEGYISQKEYDRRIKQIDDDLEKRKIDIEYKQAKRQRTIALMNVVVNTAQAIMSIWAQVPKYDYGGSAAIMTAMVTGLGALQAATILKTPLPAKGYEDGLYGDYVKREQDGKVFKSTGTSPMRSGLYSKPRILVGEGPGDMPEMVIDKQAYRQLSPETRNALLREIRGIKGFENGYYNDQTKRVEVPQDSAQTSSTSSNNDLMLVACIERNTAAINELRNNPLIAIISSKDYKSIRELDQALKTYNKIKYQSKK